MPALTLSWLHVAALLGAVQGIFLAGVLAARPHNRTANRLLATAMLAFSIHLASTVYFAAGLFDRWPHFFGVAYPLLLLYGPLIYLYARSAADRDSRLTRRDLLHFVPFAATVLAGLPIYLLGAADKIALLHQIQAGHRPLLLRIVDPLKYLLGAGYAAMTILFLRRHIERVKESYSTLERVNLRWLLRLGAAAAGIWLLAIAFQLLEDAGVATIPNSDDYISLAIAAMVYAIGYMGLRQPEIFRYETAEYPIPIPVAAAPAPPPIIEEASPPEPAAPRYERSGLSDIEARRLRDALTAVMDSERPWQNSELTLADLAVRLRTTPHKLSEVLNAEVGQSFYDYVNGYRVREVQRRIAAGDAERLTILSLALDAGFASKSTFNLVFKKHTGATPSTYRATANV